MIQVLYTEEIDVNIKKPKKVCIYRDPSSLQYVFRFSYFSFLAILVDLLGLN